MRVFLAGGSGLLGSTLSRVLVEANHVVMQHSKTTGEYAGDFRKPEQVFSILDQYMPDAIVNLIGMSSVDGCEQQPALAYQLNAGCLENIVDWVIVRNAGPLIHISTDHIYDSKGLNVEDNVVIRNMYAMTKRCSELFAQKANGVVLRTNFFGVSECKERASFSDWLVSCMSEGKKANLFNDVYFSPLTMQTFSELIQMILEKPISGVYNVGSINGMSKRDFAFCLGEQLGLNTLNFTDSSILETPFKKRPRFMEMNCNLFQDTYNISLPTLKQQIQTLR